MEKKYQVFISSTYEDLKEERKRIIDVLLQSNCIPAGMELFSATDGTQMETIKSVIDLCDYYILILGERYGSISEETGKSYTEMEYDYALLKEIPVLVFAKKIDVNNIESTEDYSYKDKLKKFREEALKNRLGVIWSDLSDLVVKVVTSINQALKQMPRVGWVRLEENITDLQDKIIRVQDENKDLLEKCRDLENKITVQNDIKYENLAFEGTPFVLHFEYWNDEIFSKMLSSYQSIQTIDEIFKNISLHISSYITNEELSNLIVHYSHGIDLEHEIIPYNCLLKVDNEDVLRLKKQYIKLGLFEEKCYANTSSRVRLSPTGQEISDKFNLIFKEVGE